MHFFRSAHPRPTRAPAPPPGARWAARLLVALPLLALCVASGVYFVKLAHVLRASLAPVAANELTRQLGHQVRLGAVDFAPGELILTNVAISNRHTWAGSRNEAAGVADRVVIHYNLHDLLFDSANAAHALGDIDLLNPIVLIERWQDRQGRTRYNFSDVLDVLTKKPKRPHAKPFQGRLLVRNGILHFRDYMAPARVHERPAYNTLIGLRGQADFASERYVFLDAAGRGGDRSKLATVAARGDVSRQAAGRFRVVAQVNDADASYWSAYFVQGAKVQAQVRVTGGRADLDMTFARLGSKPPPGLPLDLLGRVTAHDVSATLLDPRFAHVPLRHLNGTANFTGAGVSIDGNIVASDQPVQVSGTVFDFTRPRVAFTGSSPRVDVLRLARDFPQLKIPPGLGVAPSAVVAQVTGTAANPVVTVQASSPAVTYAGNRATDVRGRGLYANQVLRISSATFRLNGTGVGAVRVTVNTAPKVPTVSIGGRVAGVNLSALRLPPGVAGGKRLDLGGIADVAFLADDRAHPLAVVANVSVSHPRFGRTPLRLARGRVLWSLGRPVTISRALVEDTNGGVATVSGTVPAGGSAPLNLAVSAAGARLSSLLAPYTRLDLGGTAFAQARVGGTLAHPQVSGRVQLFGARYGKLLADVISGQVTATPDGLRLQDVLVRRYPAAAHVSGTITQLASKNPALGLTVDLSQEDAQDLISLAGEFAPPGSKPVQRASSPGGSLLSTLTGTVQARAHVTGRLKTPQVVGRASLSDATFDAYRLRQARAEFSYAGGAVRVSDALAQAEDGATVTGRGQYALKTGRLAAVLNGRDFPLDLLDPFVLKYADIEGIANFSGRVTGTIKDPTATATLTARNLSVNGQSLSSPGISADAASPAPLTVSARYADGTLTKTDGPLDLIVRYPLTQIMGGQATTGTASTRYVVDKLSLSLPTPRAPGRKSALSLSAHIPADSPERVQHLITTLRESRFARSAGGEKILGSLDALAGSPEGTLSVPSLSVSGPLSAPDVQATVNARDLTLGEDNRVGDLAAVLTYTGASPAGHLDVTANDLRLSGVPIQNAGGPALTAHADYKDQVVTVPSLDLRSEQAYLHGSGAADLSKNGRLSASVDASNVPLALFNTFLSHATPASGEAGASYSLGGEIGAVTVQASGRTLSPNLTASISLDRPSVDVTRFPGPDKPGIPETHTHYALDSIRSGALTVTDATPGSEAKILTVTNLAALKGGRPVATLSGTLPFFWQLPKAAPGQAQESALLAGVTTERPLHAELRMSDLSALAALGPAALDPKRTGGALSASVDVSGTGGVPHVAGRVDLTDGSLGLVGFDTALNKVEAHLALDGERLAVPTFSGHSSKGGSFSVTGGGAVQLVTDESGALVVRGGPDLRLTADNLKIDEAGKQTFLAKSYNSTARGTINGVVTVTDSWASPLVATAADAPIVVTDAVGTLPSPSPTEPGPKPLYPVDPRFNVAINLGGGKSKTVSVRSSLLQAEANGNVQIGGRLSAPEVKAHINVARGQFILPPATLLKIVRAEDASGNAVDLRYPGTIPDPLTGGPALETRVDLTAQARVTITPEALAAGQSAIPGFGPAMSQSAAFGQGFGTSFGQGGQRYTITAHITGPLNASDPSQTHLALSSSPPGLTQTQMLAALVPTGALNSLFGGGQGAERALQQQLLLALNQVAVPTLLSPLEESVAGALGLADFSVNYSPDAPVLVSLTKDLAPRLQVTYTRLFGARTPGAVNSLLAPPQYSLKLGYHLTNRLQFSVSTDDQRNNTLALEGVFGF